MNPHPIPGDRLAVLDVLRGLAILGIFLIHVPSMGFETEALARATAGEGPWSAVLVHGFVRAFVEMKFWAVFSMLFGAGIVLQGRRVEARGGRYGGLFLRRMGWLALAGLLHGFLLFPYEVLFLYAVLGLVLFPLRRVRPAGQIAIGIVLLAGAMLIAVWGEEGGLGEPLPRRPAEELRLEDFRELDFFEALTARLDATPGSQSEIERHANLGGSVAFTLRVRAMDYTLWLLIGLLFLGLRVLALFLLGAALFQAGFFDGPRPLHRRLLWVAGLVALPLELLTATAGMGGSAPLVTWMEAVHLASSVLLALGLVSAVMLLHERPALRAIASGLAAVGRTALSNYVLQSLLLNLLFCWWGLGLFGALRPELCLLLAFVLYLGQVALSRWWLGRFAQGPLEAGWRRAIAGRR